KCCPHPHPLPIRRSAAYVIPTDPHTSLFTLHTSLFTLHSSHLYGVKLTIAQIAMPVIATYPTVWSVAERTLRTEGLLLRGWKASATRLVDRDRCRVVLRPHERRHPRRADYAEDGAAGDAEAVRQLLDGNALQSHLHDLAVAAL